MGIQVKLLDGNDYEIQRESPFAVEDDAVRGRILLVQDLLMGVERDELELKIKNRVKNLERNQTLSSVCLKNLDREDLTPDETDKWYEKYSETSKVLVVLEEELEALNKKSWELIEAQRTEPTKLARWALMNQHGKSEVEADLLLDDELATYVCSALYGLDMQKKIEEAEKAEKGESKGGDEETSPLS